MKRMTKLFSMFATLAGLTLSAAPMALADHHEYRRGRDYEHGRRDTDRYGRHRGHPHYGHNHGDHDECNIRVQYEVRFSLDCERVFRADSRQEAIDLTHELRRYGVSARRRSERVIYSLDGECSRTFDSQRSARRLARWLERLGFDVEVVS